MSRYTLGIDTSNYATSLAVFDTAGEVVCAKKRFLPVKAGQLGLRQSDALFHHTVALPEMMQELAQEFDLTQKDDSDREILNLSGCPFHQILFVLLLLVFH